MTRRFWTLASLGVGTFGLIAVAIWFFSWRPVRYVDRENGFSIRFSPEWELLPQGEGAVVRAIVTHGVRGGGTSGVISVFATQVENIPGAAAFRGWFINQSSPSLKEFARLREGTRNVGGLETPWILYTYLDVADQVRYQVWQFFFLRGTQGYVVSCTARPADFDRFRPEFLEAVDGFRLE